MDHNPRPSNPGFPFPRVPLLSTEIFQDVDFVEYPVRAGCQQLYISKRMTLPHYEPTTNPGEIAKLEACLQGWLFFRLLHEVLDPFKLFQMDDYFGFDDKGGYVHTKMLDAALSNVSSAVKSWNVERIREFGNRLDDDLNVVNKVLHTLLAGEQRVPLEQSIWASIMSICETVAGVCQVHLDRSPEETLGRSDWPKFTLVQFPALYDLSHMTEMGWCPSEIAYGQASLRTIHGQLYLRNLSRDSLGLDHSSCSTDNCYHTQIDLALYRPKHSSRECNCELIGPDEVAVAASLRDETFPLLRLQRPSPERMSLEVVLFQSDGAYVALSHVWADGLGNPAEAVLPTCQIINLWSLIQSLHGRKFTWSTDMPKVTEEKQERRELMLWCDTLCCPTVPAKSPTDEQVALKGLAIAKLRQVYDSATYVLVLDQSLRMVNTSTTDRLELVVRVLTCRWMRRLWTLQEAALAKKLLIAFADEIVDFRTLWQHAFDVRASSPAYSNFCRSILVQCASLKSWFQTGNELVSLMRLQNAISHRQVTVPSDESICIATMLGLETEQVAAEREDRRMATVWRLVSQSREGIPNDIIFNEFPRLSTVGYRWAPSTFLLPLSSEKTMITWQEDALKASWTPAGILVQYPGWQVKVNCSLPASEHYQQHWTSERGQDIDIRLSNGRWFIAKAQRLLAKHENIPFVSMMQALSARTAYVVLSRSDIHARGQRALLTTLVEESNNRIFRSICSLWISRLSPSYEALHDLAYNCSEKMKLQPLLARHASTTTVERLARIFGTWIPAGHPKIPSRLVADTVQTARARINSNVNQLAQLWGKEASNSPRGRSATRDSGGVLGEHAVSQMILRCYFNVFAHATEVHGGSIVWCVD